MYSFPNLEPACCSMSSSNCCFLTCIQISQETGKVFCLLFLSLRIFHSLLWFTVKGFSVISEEDIDVSLEFSCIFYDPTDVRNLISGSSAFSKSTLKNWTFSVHVQLKPSLENFEHYFTSMWSGGNCAVVYTFFGIAFLWDWNGNWPFPSLRPLLSFPNLLHVVRSNFTATSFRI